MGSWGVQDKSAEMVFHYPNHRVCLILLLDSTISLSYTFMAALLASLSLVLCTCSGSCPWDLIHLAISVVMTLYPSSVGGHTRPVLWILGLIAWCAVLCCGSLLYARRVHIMYIQSGRYIPSSLSFFSMCIYLRNNKCRVQIS